MNVQYNTVTTVTALLIAFFTKQYHLSLMRRLVFVARETPKLVP